MLENLSKYIIKKIYHFFDDSSPYGLSILFLFSNNQYLLFDSFRFYFGSNITIFNKYDWKEISHNSFEKNTIVKIKEDEMSNFFILFSDKSIFHIYQRIFNLQHWELEFEIVKQSSSEKYIEVYEHMNEDWVFDCELLISN